VITMLIGIYPVFAARRIKEIKALHGT